MRKLAALLLFAFSLESQAAPGQGTLLDKLPAGATVVVGLTRTIPEKDLREALAQLQKQMGDAVPPCAVELFTKLERAVVAVELGGGDPEVSFVLRGAGIKSAYQACLGNDAPRL